MLDQKTIESIADELVEAGRSRTPVPRLTARYPDMTVEDSYAVQRLWRRAERGSRPEAGGPEDWAYVQGHAGRHWHHRTRLRRHFR